MDKIKKISRWIDSELNFTNGWRIPDEDYEEHCTKVATKIVKHFEKSLAEQRAEIRVNNYTISKFESATNQASIWIQQDDGEGMELDIKKLWENF